MKKKFEYSFDDEIAKKSCYDVEGKVIEIHFSRYYDISSDKYVDKSCVWVIENWVDAKSKLSSENSFKRLEHYLGVISMVLSVEMDMGILELTVNTIDGRYIDLLFDNPQLKLLV